MTEETQQVITSILIVGGIFGGWLMLLGCIGYGVEELKNKIKNLFGWQKWDLTQEEKNRLSSIHDKKKQSVEIEKIINARGLKAKEWTYSNVTRILKVK